jgi:hypothetical protein
LKINVSLQNIAAKSVALDISGLNMYMGYNRVALKQVKPGLWQGQSMLAFCTNQAMEWQLSVLITTEADKQLQIPFYLETQRNPLYPTPK